jgi:TRAP-type C4-dicarboxylate transport system permease large subunit
MELDILGIVILVVSFIFFLVLGVPVAYSIGLSALATMLVSFDALPAFSTMAQRMATGIESFSLLAIPFFILAGQIMNSGGIALRLIEFAKVLVGRLPGGLAFVNVMANMLFGAISGSAAAAASAIGSIMGPQMKNEGYDENFSAAVNVTSATTGLAIPPSNILIVYSLASGGVSIGALFLAGYIPGILTGVAIMLMAMSMVLYKKNGFSSTLKTLSKVFAGFIVAFLFGLGLIKLNSLVSSTINSVVHLTLIAAFVYWFVLKVLKHKQGAKRALIVLLRALPSLLLLIIVIGGIVAGYFTATEASAIAVVYCLVLAMIYKEVKVKDLPQILIRTVKTTGIVMLLIATSIGLSWVMSFENIPQTVSDGLLSVSSNPFVILLLINLILLFVGIFMDMTPAVLIFTPIFLPIVTTQLGLDPIHFGIIMILNLNIGLCTPPVGSVLFIGCSVANLKIQDVVKPLIPLFIAMIVVLVIITLFPSITMYIPNLFGF